MKKKRLKSTKCHIHNTEKHNTTSNTKTTLTQTRRHMVVAPHISANDHKQVGTHNLLPFSRPYPAFIPSYKYAYAGRAGFSTSLKRRNKQTLAGSMDVCDVFILFSLALKIQGKLFSTTIPLRFDSVAENRCCR